MKITIKHFVKPLELSVLPTNTIEYIKMQIFNIYKIPVENQRLIFDGRQLENKEIISDCNIVDDSAIYFISRTSFETDKEIRDLIKKYTNAWNEHNAI